MKQVLSLSRNNLQFSIFAKLKVPENLTSLVNRENLLARVTGKFGQCLQIRCDLVASMMSPKTKFLSTKDSVSHANW
jgi:hypothetical protein